MDEFPVKVTIVIPTRVGHVKGQNSTSHGLTMAIRLPIDEGKTIDRARQITGFDLSRGGFIRLAAFRVAEEICKHNDAYIASKKEVQDDTDTRADIRPSSE